MVIRNLIELHARNDEDQLTRSSSTIEKPHDSMERLCDNGIVLGGW